MTHSTHDKTSAHRNEYSFAIKVLTRLMVGRALCPGEERLVFNFHMKSKVWLEQLHMCAGSSWRSGFCVETLVEVLPVQYQLCTEELCDGLFSSRVCRSSAEAVTEVTHGQLMLLAHRPLMCMHVVCCSSVSVFQQKCLLLNK